MLNLTCHFVKKKRKQQRTGLLTKTYYSDNVWPNIQEPCSNPRTQSAIQLRLFYLKQYITNTYIENVMKSVQFFIITYNTLFFFKKNSKLMKDSKRKIQLCLDYLVCSENCQTALCRSAEFYPMISVINPDNLTKWM